MMWEKSLRLHSEPSRYIGQPPAACSARIADESGIAAILLVIVIMLLVTALFSAFIARIELHTHQALEQAQRNYLANAQTALRNWYTEHASEMDAGGSGSTLPFQAQEILAKAGVAENWNAELFVSNEQCIPTAQAQLCYHTLWLAVPAVAGPAPSLQGGQFNPGAAQYVSVSGRSIETAQYTRAENQLADMSSMLETGFAGAEGAGGVHDTNLDWFAPPGCGANGDGPFACSNSVFIPWSSYLSGSGFGSPGYNQNAWGLPVQVNNPGGQANDTSPPYAVEIESPLPWGGDISALVTETL